MKIIVMLMMNSVMRMPINWIQTNSADLDEKLQTTVAYLSLHILLKPIGYAS